MPERILLVDDEVALRRNLARYLEQAGHAVVSFGSAEEALAGLGGEEFGVALLDLRLPGKDGLSLATELTARFPDLLVLVMTAYGSVESVIEALRSGVHDYVVKPLLLKDVAVRIERMCEQRNLVRENARLRRRLAEEAPGAGPVHRSRVMAELFSFVRTVAASPSTVLIEGESGAGKEVVARALHEASARRDGPFVAVNLAAIPDTLLESHLFGHEKGAFTGADSARGGFFRAATGGTLFLDEIGEMSLGSQAKVLRAIEAKEVTPVGSDRPVRADARLVAATNADLAALVQEKRFRSDLYYRLSTIRVKVPPLRERPEDIPALAQHLLARHAREHQRPASGIDGAAMRRLLTYSWPGNVRELSNVIERALVICPGASVGVVDLPPEVVGEAAAAGHGYEEAMIDFERALLRSTLERTSGDRREAAQVLGLSLATLYRRVEKLGLKRDDEHEKAAP